MNFLSPVFNEQTFDANGDPLVGGKVYTYVAGTSTPLQTYTTQNGVIQHSNPIILDARGEPPTLIWLIGSGQEYKFVLHDANDNLIRTLDDISGINAVTSTADEWIVSAITPTYINATSFSVVGDQTLVLSVGRRIRTENTGGTIYGTITSSVFGAGITTIVVRNDSGILDSGLSSIAYGILAPDNPSLPNSQSARNTLGLGSTLDVASAAALPLSTCLGNLVRVTGTTTTTSVVMSNGQQVTCVAVGAWPINIPGVLAYTCSAGDLVFFSQDNNGSQHAYIVRTTPNLMRGYIDGLIMSTAGSSTTMAISAGQATDTSNALNLILSASINKTTSAWAVGSGNGGLDTGAIANSTWYYFYVIRRPDTGVVDVVFSTNSSIPTLPANYTQYRYIGAGLTNGSAQWTRFYQYGDEFVWDTPPTDANTNATTTPTLYTLSVPRKILQAHMSVISRDEAANSTDVKVYNPAITAVASSNSTAATTISVTSSAGTIARIAAPVSCFTNASAQVMVVSSKTSVFEIRTTGWTDTRGKN